MTLQQDNLNQPPYLDRPSQCRPNMNQIPPAKFQTPLKPNAEPYPPSIINMETTWQSRNAHLHCPLSFIHIHFRQCPNLQQCQVESH